MKLSIIIVNYNVKYFLEHCLCSVQKAIQNIEAEILVVDNNSTDGSIEYLQPLFETVTFIRNKKNLGFARANNRGLKMASGEYTLFLNPDTLVPQNAFAECISFLENNPSTGAVGIRMLDGSGNFLKESKRSFPSPVTSLYKLLGLSVLFPKSHIFSRYHLGHLNEQSNHEVDVLSGAFMMVRKKILDNIGGFDNAFFMYGEDIDLSYRIQKAGYKNFYLAQPTIIHFKGESTNKGSFNYVNIFYQAMEIFVKKHYGGTRKKFFVLLLQFAIWFRAIITMIASFIKRANLPVIDWLLVFSSFFIVKAFWNNYIKPQTFYDLNLLSLVFAAFTSISIFVGWLYGFYDNLGYKLQNIVKASLISIVILLAVYSVFPLQYRFSRGIIIFGSGIGFVFILLARIFFTSAGILKQSPKGTRRLPGVVVGSKSEFDEVMKLLHKSGEEKSIIGRIGFNDTNYKIGELQNISQIQIQTGFKKIIFSVGTIGYLKIIEAIGILPVGMHLRFHNCNTKSIIGSYSKNETGETNTLHKQYRLNNPYYKRLKRLLDIVAAFFFIITFPFHLIFVKTPRGFFLNSLSVFLGKKTWIGYNNFSTTLPLLKPAVISFNGKIIQKTEAQKLRNTLKLDEWYAREYSVWMDVGKIFKFYSLLGGSQ